MLTLAGRQTLSPEAVQSVVDGGRGGAWVASAGCHGGRLRTCTCWFRRPTATIRGRSRRRGKVSARRPRPAGGGGGVDAGRSRPGHVHAEASIRMNFDKVNETQEQYDPDGSLVRSTQNVTLNSKSTDKAAPVPIQNNFQMPMRAQPRPGTRKDVRKRRLIMKSARRCGRSCMISLRSSGSLWR